MRDRIARLRRLAVMSVAMLAGVALWFPSWALEPTFRDVAYGPHERNKLDLYQAPLSTPTPLIVHIHGGGFYEGDKNGFWGSSDAELKHAIASGVSLASINYPFIGDAPLQEIVRNSARAIQFLRYNAAAYNIDKTRVAAYGDSAGAGTSLWLAFHDDLADADNADPVLRESTHLVAAGGLFPQATYDFAKWPAILRVPQYVWYLSIWHVAPKYYHLSPPETCFPNGTKIRADLDILSWIDASDPPVYLFCDHPESKLTYANLFLSLFRKLSNTDPKSLVNLDILHHPAHTHALENACKEKGVPCTAVYANTPPGQRTGVYDFLLERLRRR